MKNDQNNNFLPKSLWSTNDAREHLIETKRRNNDTWEEISSTHNIASYFAIMYSLQLECTNVPCDFIGRISIIPLSSFCMYLAKSKMWIIQIMFIQFLVTLTKSRALDVLIMLQSCWTILFHVKEKEILRMCFNSLIYEDPIYQLSCRPSYYLYHY